LQGQIETILGLMLQQWRHVKVGPGYVNPIPPPLPVPLPPYNMTSGGNNFNDFPEIVPEKSQPKYKEDFSFSRPWP